MKTTDAFQTIALLFFQILPFFIGQWQMILGDKTLYYQTSPCPNYSLWQKAISVDGAVLKSSDEFHGDCRITFRVPYPDRQRFLLRFESVNIRECHDRLVIYDADDLIDATRLDELSCRSHVDRTRFLYTSNAGGYVTIRYYTYNKGELPSDFRLVLTAVSKFTDSAYCSFRCANNYCISAELRCDSEHINHCGDNSDELNCRASAEGGGHKYEAREFLGMSITVTIIITLSVLFVTGVCVCSIALFVCKRNHIPQNVTETAAPPPSRISHGDAISSSDATSSTARSHTAYTPVLTDFDNVVGQSSARIYHGKSRPSPLLPFRMHPDMSTLTQTYSPAFQVPGTPRPPGGMNAPIVNPAKSTTCTQFLSAEASKKLLYF